MRDALILAPVSIAVLVLIWALDSVMMGASGDLVDRYLPLYFAAWIVAWLVGSLLLRLPFIPRDASHFTRCLVVIVMFWPIHGLASALAEEWTVSHRKATWTEPSDMGYTYMYGEMSGMGYAHGWADWDRKVRSHSLASSTLAVLLYMEEDSRRSTSPMTSVQKPTAKRRRTRRGWATPTSPLFRRRFSVTPTLTAVSTLGPAGRVASA